MRVRRKADKDAADAAKVAEAAEATEATPETPAADVMRVGEAAPGADEGTNHVRHAVEAPTPEPEPEAVQPPLQRAHENPTTDDFAAMLGEAPVEVTHYYRGDKVKATVVGVGKDAVFVSLGAKAEGFVMRSELVDDTGRLTVGVGDEVEGYVIRTSAGGIEISTALSQKNAGAEMLEQAQAHQIPVEGTVTEANQGGYRVDIMGSSAFCPHSQIDINYTDDPNVHVGQTYTFLVSRVEEGGKNVVVSRADFMRREREAQAEETLKELRVGFETDGVVTRVAKFGAFVDIGGLDGLVHVSEMSWSRVEDPAEVVAVGETVRVKVMRLEHMDNPDERRIGLSMKELDEDPWLTAARMMQIGDTYTGTVQRLERFGAFVELRPGVDGLLHVSELVHGRRVNHPRDVLNVGEKIQVQLLDIDPVQRRISLSMKALAEDPWSQAQSAYPPGTTVQGTVESVRDFGIFVALPIGVTALLPLSQLGADERDSYLRKFTPGSAIEASVLDIELARQRMTLTRRADADENGEMNYRAFQAKQAPASGGSGMGTFADLLKKRR